MICASVRTFCEVADLLSSFCDGSQRISCLLQIQPTNRRTQTLFVYDLHIKEQRSLVCTKWHYSIEFLCLFFLFCPRLVVTPDVQLTPSTAHFFRRDRRCVV